MAGKMKKVRIDDTLDLSFWDFDSMSMEQLERLLEILDATESDILALQENLDLIDSNETIH